MKFLITGDLHLRASTPENRIDNFFEAQLNKMEQVFKLASENKCQAILCPGDVFDNPRPSFDVLEYYIKLFKKYNIGHSNNDEIEFLTVWGQHDQRFRTKERTALRLMESLGYIQTFKKITYGRDIHIYGCDYGDEIPNIKEEDEDDFNILLIHKTILDKKPFWAEECLLSDKVFKKYEYDVTVCGDYHFPSYYQNKHQTIVNCGCIVRKSIAEAEIKPNVYILNMNEKDLTYTLKKIELIYEPADKVFRQEALNREVTKENAKLKEFIESIKNNEISSSLDFKKNLETMMKTSDKAVKDIILKSLEEIEK